MMTTLNDLFCRRDQEFNFKIIYPMFCKRLVEFLIIKPGLCSLQKCEVLNALKEVVP